MQNLSAVCFSFWTCWEGFWVSAGWSKEDLYVQSSWVSLVCLCQAMLIVWEEIEILCPFRAHPSFSELSIWAVLTWNLRKGRRLSLIVCDCRIMKGAGAHYLITRGLFTCLVRRCLPSKVLTDGPAVCWECSAIPMAWWRLLMQRAGLCVPGDGVCRFESVWAVG